MAAAQTASLALPLARRSRGRSLEMPMAGRAQRAASPHRTQRVADVSPSRSPARSLVKPATVHVIAPGGGTGVNSAVYSEVGQDPRFKVNIVGQSRANYDCYPEEWAHGCPPPNLSTFASELMKQGIVEGCDLLVVGSRGGQVVLPNLWSWGAKVPPTVIINGGCAMKLPTAVCWPDTAVTFLLLGGQDNFRGEFSHEEYFDDARSWVPKGNTTTAILYVNEMQHMPQRDLLRAVLPHMFTALQKWKESGVAPLQEFTPMISELKRGGWSGCLAHTRAPGKWEDISFNTNEVPRLVLQGSETTCVSMRSRAEPRESQPIELTRQDEHKALWKAAAAASLPTTQKQNHELGTHFTEVVQMAMRQTTKANVTSPPEQQAVGQSAAQHAVQQPAHPTSPSRQRPTLPLAMLDHGSDRGICTASRSSQLFASPSSSYSRGNYQFFVESPAVMAQA